jgi:hypothetical protein
VTAFPFCSVLTLWLQDGLTAAQRAGLQQLLEDDGKEWQQAGSASRPGSSMAKPGEEQQQQRRGPGSEAAITSPRPRPGEVPAMLPPRQARRQLGAAAAAAPVEPAGGSNGASAAPTGSTWSFGHSWGHPAVSTAPLATCQAASWSQRAVVQGQQEEDDDDMDSLLAVGASGLEPAEAAGAGAGKQLIGHLLLCVTCRR